MPPYKNIALLIDADNTQPPMMDAIMKRLLALGPIPIRRAYANWRKEALKPWIDITKRHALKPEQQFDYVSGKNATDMALTIAAMDLLHGGLYDCFAIVSSDSDFTPLALRLREAGVSVIGLGRENTPEAFRSCCNDFIALESLEPRKAAEQQQAPAAAAKPGATPNKPAPAKAPTLAEVQDALCTIIREQGDDRGRLSVQVAGTELRKRFQNVKGFNLKNYGGRSTVTTFCSLFPELFKVIKGGKGKITSLSCIEPAAAATPAKALAAPPAEPQPQPAPPAAPAQPQPQLVPTAPEEPETLVLSPVDSMVRRVQQLFREAHAALADHADTFVMLSAAGAYLRKDNPTFSVKTLSYAGPKAFLQSFPELFELHEEKLEKTSIFSYRPRS